MKIVFSSKPVVHFWDETRVSLTLLGHLVVSYDKTNGN